MIGQGPAADPEMARQRGLQAGQEGRSRAAGLDSEDPVTILARVVRRDDAEVPATEAREQALSDADHLGVRPAFGFLIGSIFALMIGLASWRYTALLLCTRRRSGRWLPWQLARFLRWCYDAGLLRIAGIGYQLRHRELQDYLARNATAHMVAALKRQPEKQASSSQATRYSQEH